MNGIAMQMIFSPQNCSLELLDKTLTADRRKLAKQILARIQGSIQTRTSHYSLIIGARGTGKTHLLTYIWKHLHVQYANDPSIKIISLAEEERGITSLLDFLIACMRSVGISGDVVASRIRDGGYPSPAEAARELFHEVVTAESTLIVIENLSYIFESLEEEGLADLRGFFQDHPSISVLASSVTLFTDSSKADNPFYGFFNIHPLKPLDRKDARMYLLIQSRVKGDAELATALEKEESQARVNAIYDLTGGNHRLLAMLSTFLSADGLAELVGPFVQMADRELTPYYQQRLDRLSPQQNKLVRVIADYHGRALSVNEIAHSAFLSPQSVSRQLYDLLHGGYVVRNKVGRESCYELREPLLRLVLDIKEGRDRPLSLIVKFLRSWYSIEELTKLAAATPLYVKRYYDTALTEKKHVKEDRLTEAYTRHEPSTLLKEKLGQDILKKAVIAAKSSEWSTLSEFFDQFFEEVPEEPRAWFTGAVALQLSGRLEAALAAYDEVVKRFSDSDRVELLEQVARAMVNKGITLGALQRSEDEIAAYDEVVKRFSDSDRVELLEQVARALVNKGVTLGALQRSEEAIAAYDEVVKRFSDSDRVELLEPVAKAMVNKGIRLGELQRSEEAIAAYDEVVKRFSDSDRVEFLEQVARALFNKGIRLGALQRSEEAITAYDEVVKRFSDSDRVELLEPVARALFNKGIRLGELQRSEEAIAVYDEVVKRFSDSDRVELLEQVARALFNKGIRLGALQRSEEAITAYDEVVKRFSDSDRVELLEPVAKAMVNKGVTLGALQRSEDEIAAYDEVVKRFSDSDRVELLEQVARALFNKGIRLGALQRSEEAITAYDEVVKRFSDSDRVELLEPVARALVNKGIRLGELQRSEEAIAVYDEVVKRFSDSDRVELLEQVARALFNKGIRLGALQRSEEAITAYDEVVKRFSDSDRVELLEPVARALVNKGIRLGELQRSEEAIAVYDEVVKRFSDSDRVKLLEQVARALGARVEALARLGHKDDALFYLEDMLRRVPLTHWARALIVSRLLDKFIQDENRLRQMVLLYKDDADSLISGLISWIQNQMPLTRSDAEKLEDADKMLQSLFAGVPDAAPALQLLQVARRDASGDRKALLDLPIEMRRLVKTDSTKDEI